MSIQSRNTLKAWFETGDKPTQQQFWHWLDSFIHHTDDSIEIEDIAGMADLLNTFALSSSVTAALDALKGGVPSAGDTLNKLYNLIVGLGEFAGNHDASGGALPATGTGNGGAIDKGDYWYITNAGTIAGLGDLAVGDVLFAKLSGADEASEFFYLPFASLVGDASETQKGVAEISDQTESEDAATNGTIDNIDHTRIISGRGLRWFWEKVKTLTVALNDVQLKNQIQSGKNVPVCVRSSDGQLIKLPWIEFDIVNQKITATGVDNLSTTVLELLNDSGQLITKFRNDQVLEVGGSDFIIQVPTGISSGNAYLKINDNKADALHCDDQSGNFYFTIRSETGDLAIEWQQKQEYDYGVGFKKIHIQKVITTDTTAAQWNNILRLPLSNSQSAQVFVNHLHAHATDDSVAFASFNKDGYARRSSVGTVSGTNPTFTISGDGITGVNWRVNPNDTDKSLDIDFQNNSGTGKTWTVFLDVTYILRNTPT